MISVLLLVGCWEPEAVVEPPGFGAAQAAFATGNLTESKPLVSSLPSKSLNLYLDASGSMQGFAAIPYSEYNSVLESLLDQAATADYELQAFRFAEGVTPQNLSVTELRTSGFYNGKRTSFTRLCEHILATRAAGKVSIVVTDLVQSEQVEDQRALARAFAELARNGFKVSLLAFRSVFVGTYWVESGSTRDTRLQLKLAGEPLEETRPFYVLMIAPSADDLMEARKNLVGTTLNPMQEYQASAPGLVAESIGMDSLGGAPSDVWSPYSEPVVEDGEEGIRRVWWQLLDFGGDAAVKEDVRLSLTLTAESEVPASRLRTANGVKVDVEGRTYAQGTWTPRPVRKDLVEVLFTPGNSRVLKLIAHVERPRSGEWDLYRIRLSPGSRNLESPSWVGEWNTDDDQTRALANRTLNLDLFIDVLKTSITEKTPFTDLFLQVGRGAI